MIIKVKSFPDVRTLGDGESGIHTVIRNYDRLAAQYDIEFVPHDASEYDVIAIHAGTAPIESGRSIVSHLHGLYFTGDYSMPAWAYRANQHIIESIRHAREVTVPSYWVGEILRRDMRLSPHVLPHGINHASWPYQADKKEVVMAYAKNRSGIDVCDPSFLREFAARFPNIKFLSTFTQPGFPNNVKETGVLSHDDYRYLVSNSRVYISTTKETFGIGILEALACGTPVVAFRNGGAVDLVEHGVTGYLAVPGNYDDLAQGFKYCWNHQPQLGANAHIASKKFSWDGPMTILHNVYSRATRVDDLLKIGVVIPVYNKRPEQLRRALDSVLAQTVKAQHIIVVDDGSNNDYDYSSLVRSYNESFIEYVRQENAGVAEARNNGIRHLKTKYVVCLDADDALDPQFMEACVEALDNDGSLGIAYTGLQWVREDGRTGLSQWPGEYNYDAFYKYQNQIPTCNMMRKEAWERVGGFHSRYCPNGAGEEDANLWVRIGAIGYGAKKVTDAGLFIYSDRSGQVSGNREHKATDWLALLPYARDGIQPIASMAKPRRHSHPVYQYDEPVVSVIIPVGKGHEKLVRSALDTVEAQSMRRWEAIVVWDSPVRAGVSDLLKSYPYIRFHAIEPLSGAGAARNAGVDLARADLILFLDADDQLHPEALAKMLQNGHAGRKAIYSNYIGKAIVKDVNALAPDLQKNIISYNERTGEINIKHKLSNYDPLMFAQMPDDKPYIWCNITTLIPRHWHYEIGGFDEDMESWEDVDYWHRLARAGKDFHRIDEELMMYRFAAGYRREHGLHNWNYLLQYLKDKKEKAVNGMQGVR